jgi:hypothetical protein
LFPSGVESVRSLEPRIENRTSGVSRMRMGTVKSDLISKVGYDDKTMRVTYTDGATFEYSGVPLSTYKALLRSHHIGTDWLNLRDQYKFKPVR